MRFIDVNLDQFLTDFYSSDQEIFVGANWLQGLYQNLLKYERANKQLNEENEKLREKIRQQEACIEYLKGVEDTREVLRIKI